MKNSCIYNNWQDINNKKTTYTKIATQQLEICKNSISNHDNIVLDVYETSALQKAQLLDSNHDTKNILTGVTFLLKDNVNLIGKKTTSGSLVCKDFISPYNATIVDNINKHQGIILGKVNLDEFAHAGTGTWSAFGNVVNPLDVNAIVGGSSSGSVAAIKLKMCDVAIGSDTGDSIRHPASFLGVVGYKPSYGLVSRYGITPFASSLDHVGVLTNSVADAAIGTDIIKGHDNKDSTSVNLGNELFSNSLKLTTTKFKLLVLTDVLDFANNQVKNQFNKFVDDLKDTAEISFTEFGRELLTMLSPIYNSASYFEGLTNWNNVSGITFGGKNTDYKSYKDLAYKIRSNFGHEVKNRYMIANLMHNDQNFELIYENTTKIRRIIVNRVNELLDEYDAILIPSSSSYAPDLSTVLAREYKPNVCDDTLMIANFAGLPSISLPLTSPTCKQALDINLTSKKFSDSKLLNIAYNLEDFIERKGYYNE